MKISHLVETKTLIIEINEEIDHHMSEIIRRRVDYEIQRFIPKKVVFDFGQVKFMDSAGIGLLIGRYKTAKIYGSEIELINVNEKIKKIFEMAGILKIMNIVEKSDVSFYSNN